jgi:Tfp pilus assembly protein PilX
MNTRKFIRSKEGSVLVATLGLLIVISVLCATVMELVSQQYKLSKQTVGWNQAIYSAESGVDIAWNEMNKLTAINTNGTFMSGWTASGSTFTKTGTIQPLGGIDASGSYTVTVDTNVTVNGVSGGATITATGYNYGSFSATNINRTVEVQVTPVTGSTALSFAMLAKGLIDFNGNAATMDSFNSSTASGGIWSTTARRAHGSAATDGQLIDAAGLDIYGSLQTGPGGTVTTDTGFRLYQPSSPDTGTNTVSNGFRTTIGDARLPTGFTPTTTYTTISSATTINAVAGTTQVQVGSIALSGNNDKIIIQGPASGVAGTVQIYVTGDTSIKGNTSIEVQVDSHNTTAVPKVEIYAAGSVSMGGNSVDNATAKAGNLIIYGLPTCTSVTIGGTVAYTGVIYAPEAALKINGNSTVNGAVVADHITAVGTIDFHYDEALSGVTFSSGILNFQVASWKEK